MKTEKQLRDGIKEMSNEIAGLLRREREIKFERQKLVDELYLLTGEFQLDDIVQNQHGQKGIVCGIYAGTCGATVYYRPFKKDGSPSKQARSMYRYEKWEKIQAADPAQPVFATARTT